MVRSAARRSTSNRNDRGSAEQRRRRKAWLVEHWRANVDLAPPFISAAGSSYMADGEVYSATVAVGSGTPACRCWECGTLLTAKTVVADRIIPGSEGGTYRRDNLRPHCKSCSEQQGGRIGTERRRAK